MKTRADTSRKGPLLVQAVYSTRALAQAAGVSPWLLLRLLRAARVNMLHAGRAMLIPLVEIEAKLPALWKSIVLAERVRQTGR